MMLSDVCLTSVAYIGLKSTTGRPRKTKIGTEVAHVTRNSNTTSKVKRSKVKVTRPLYSPPCWRIRQLQWWRGNVLAVETAATLPSARRREALRRPRGGEWVYRGSRPPTACLLLRCGGGLAQQSVRWSQSAKLYSASRVRRWIPSPGTQFNSAWPFLRG